MERTCPAKNRINSDKIDFFFQEDPWMDLASLGFGFQIDLKSQSRTACWQNSTEAVFVSNYKVHFWRTVIWQLFFPIIMLSATLSFFCQIVMGNPLNNKVPEGRSVNYLWVFPKLSSNVKRIFFPQLTSFCATRTPWNSCNSRNFERG